jgi:hypothetical protein
MKNTYQKDVNFLFKLNKLLAFDLVVSLYALNIDLKTGTVYCRR